MTSGACVDEGMDSTLDNQARPGRVTRRELLREGSRTAAALGLAALAEKSGVDAAPSGQKPNVVIAFADQWRAQATGYLGDPNVKTPHLEALARQSLSFTNAVSGCPVCSPYRGSLMTGQYPLTHGVFVNDVYLRPQKSSLARVFAAAGYDTAYIGKWHLDGHGRSSYIPRERRQGFDYWKVLECTHDYNHSKYYADDSDKALVWDGYDAIAQTEDAGRYIRSHGKTKPFLLVLSWGPPHNPYDTAPKRFRDMYKPEDIRLRGNVPTEDAPGARRDLAGYYAHCSALDECVGRLLKTLEDAQMADNTVFVFTSDHGDMLGSHGQQRKQRPWDEAVRVPMLLRYPKLGRRGQEMSVPVNAPDIMPTLLGLCEIPIPEGVEGLDFSGYARGGKDPSDGAALLACYHPFGEWRRSEGGREFRGVRTSTHTYVRALDGPWMLFDNVKDPLQMDNLANRQEHAKLQRELENRLQKKLKERHDQFLPGMDYIRKWGYRVDATGTVPHSP